MEYPRLIINSMCIWEFSEQMYNRELLFEVVSQEIARIEGQVDFLAMVCNTVHCILEPLRQVVRVPLLAIQEEVIKKIRQDELRKVGILGTKITVDSQIYKQELDKYGIESCWLPDSTVDAFNHLIFKEMLRGSSYDLMHLRLKEYADLLVAHGCEGIILGCTEFPLFISQLDVPVPLYASTQILAESVFSKCLGSRESFSEHQ